MNIIELLTLNALKTCVLVLESDPPCRVRIIKEGDNYRFFVAPLVDLDLEKEISQEEFLAKYGQCEIIDYLPNI